MQTERDTKFRDLLSKDILTYLYSFTLVDVLVAYVNLVYNQPTPIFLAFQIFLSAKRRHILRATSKFPIQKHITASQDMFW